MTKRSGPVIRFERGGHDRLLPRDFFEIITRRLLPVLSLTYVATVFGVAAKKGDFFHYMTHDKSAYITAFYVSLWVLMPAVLWIILKGSHLYNHVADLWYQLAAFLMIALLGLSYLLFPEMGFMDLRLYFAASIPVLVILYYFFVKGGLPGFAAHPLTALGATFLIYGATINIFH